MARSTSYTPFLGLPGEVRQNIYDQLFRNTKVEIHNRAAPFAACRHRERTTNCIGLLVIAKGVNREATCAFLEKADFFMSHCNCWKDNTAWSFELPLINNLIIAELYSDLSYRRTNAPRNISKVLEWRFKISPDMESLRCHFAIYDRGDNGMSILSISFDVS